MVHEGDLDGVERLLEADPERIAEVDAQGRKPLHAAAAQADLPAGAVSGGARRRWATSPFCGRSRRSGCNRPLASHSAGRPVERLTVTCQSFLTWTKI